MKKQDLKTGMIDLTKFNFPKVTGADFAFPTFSTDQKLLAEAKERGFYNGHTPYNKLFSTLFFSGGKVQFKKNLDVEFVKSAWAYCRCFMGSFAPKHEEKEAICALIMSEILLSELAKQ
jgi:hypothetical protein